MLISFDDCHTCNSRAYILLRKVFVSLLGLLMAILMVKPTHRDVFMWQCLEDEQERRAGVRQPERSNSGIQPDCLSSILYREPRGRGTHFPGSEDISVSSRRCHVVLQSGCLEFAGNRPGSAAVVRLQVCSRERIPETVCLSVLLCAYCRLLEGSWCISKP